MTLTASRLRRGSILWLACLLLTPLFPACNLSSPVKEVTPENLKAMVAARSTLAILDTRSDYEFTQGRIPGAIHVPPERFSSLVSILPSDKKTALVFYCRGFG